MQKAIKDDTLKPKVEKILEDIDYGKTKVTRYKNAEDYLKHIDETRVILWQIDFSSHIEKELKRFKSESDN
jgi:hypothetical protein